MALLELLLMNLGLVMGLMFALWLVSLPLRNASIVDIFWGGGFVVIACATVVAIGSASPRGLLISILTTLWGMRLAGYLAWRNIGKGEDYRYRAMREQYGSRFPLISLFVVFWLQGLIMWLVSLPIQTAHGGPAPLGWVDVVGAIVWSVGWLFECIGDFQLARFKANPENSGKVMDGGLWRYTRHPNYFGDFLVWWGLYLIALAGGAWWTMLSPIIMSVLLMRVSGVTLLERSLKERRPGYRDYVARTSVFFPWPPRRTPRR
jgi:steroid 5-alpha reductase family enzyme